MIQTAAHYEAVIGLEVHAQILTESKMFCGCSTDYLSAAPNSNTCPVCLGLPGSLPVINRRALEATFRTALALNCEISEFAKFDRKNYFYPDLPKGYQISQYDLPFSRRGYLEFEADGESKRCGITRVHLEEDTGKLLHEGEQIHLAQASLVDFNRSGVPLMEIVSEPDLRSAEEAREYVTRLRAILQYIGVNEGDMESGQLRCDANVSLRPTGSTNLGTKVEIKNMNSFRAIHRAIAYEIERQTEVLESGGSLVQETRGWNEAGGVTVSQRGKEYAEDYRYFPEPDLPPLTISREWVEEIRQSIPELPAARRARFMAAFGLTPYNASLLTTSRATAQYFEDALKAGAPAKAAANWILVELNALLNADRRDISQVSIKPQHLADLIGLIDRGAITRNMAKGVFAEMYRTGEAPASIVARQGLSQITGETELDALVDQVLGENPTVVAEYKAGKEKAFMFLVGQAMRLSKGRANPERLNMMLRQKLS